MARNTKLMLALVAAVVVMAGVVVAFFPFTGGKHSTTTWSPPANLPSGCEKPAGGYLIIADEEGFNGSKMVGSPTASWPNINVTRGSAVNIVVCNADTFTHGFQIDNYFNSNIESVAPGQVITVSFMASKAGTFRIYCSIFCPVHVFMQSGELSVTA